MPRDRFYHLVVFLADYTDNVIGEILINHGRIRATDSERGRFEGNFSMTTLAAVTHLDHETIKPPLRTALIKVEGHE